MTNSKRRKRLLQQLDRKVGSGRVTEQEAGRLRAAGGPGEFDQAVRDIRVRHAGARLDAAVADGSMSLAEADDLLERLRNGEHPRSLRAHLHGLRPGVRSRTVAPGSARPLDGGPEDTSR